MSLSDRFGRDDDDDWKDEVTDLEKEGRIEVPDDRPIVDGIQYKDQWGAEWFILEDPLKPKTWVRIPAEKTVEVRQ